MKNIWIINHYATKPDEPATRSFDFARELVRKGNKVSIFASSFSHYKLAEKYLKTEEKWKKEEYEGVVFYWIKSFSYKKNDWRRIFNMLTFSKRACWLGKKINEKPDVVIASSPHLFSALAAYFVAKKKKSKFIFEVRDLWPQTLIDIGFLPANNPLVFILRKIEKFLYKKAEKIITVLPYADRYIISLGILKEKIAYIPNGVDLKRYENIKPYVGGSSVFMYAGIHSRYANLDIVLKAAEILQKEKLKAKFIIIGNGLEKDNLVKMAEDMKLENVDFRPMVRKEEVFKILGEADCFISIIRDMPVLYKYGIGSNKLNDYLVSGRPVVFCVNSKNNPVEESGAGITVEPGNPDALASAFKKIISLTPEERILMGKRGMEYIKNTRDIKILGGELEKLI